MPVGIFLARVRDRRRLAVKRRRRPAAVALKRRRPGVSQCVPGATEDDGITTDAAVRGAMYGNSWLVVVVVVIARVDLRRRTRANIRIRVRPRKRISEKLKKCFEKTARRRWGYVGPRDDDNIVKCRYNEQTCVEGGK